MANQIAGLRNYFNRPQVREKISKVARIAAVVGLVALAALGFATPHGMVIGISASVALGVCLLIEANRGKIARLTQRISSAIFGPPPQQQPLLQQDPDTRRRARG